MDSRIERQAVPWDLLAVLLGNRVADLVGNRVADLQEIIIKERSMGKDIK